MRLHFNLTYKYSSYHTIYSTISKSDYTWRAALINFFIIKVESRNDDAVSLYNCNCAACFRDKVALLDCQKSFKALEYSFFTTRTDESTLCTTNCSNTKSTTWVVNHKRMSVLVKYSRIVCPTPRSKLRIS